MENELYHYGRKGMKWYQNIFTSGKKGSGRKGAADDESNEKPKLPPDRTSKKALKSMSNEDLTARLERLKLEKELRELEGKAYPTKGKDFVLKVLEKSGDNIATQFTTLIMGEATNKVLQEIMGHYNPKYKNMKFVNPKKGQKDKG